MVVNSSKGTTIDAKKEDIDHEKWYKCVKKQHLSTRPRFVNKTYDKRQTKNCVYGYFTHVAKQNASKSIKTQISIQKNLDSFLSS